MEGNSKAESQQAHQQPSLAPPPPYETVQVCPPPHYSHFKNPTEEGNSKAESLAPHQQPSSATATPPPPYETVEVEPWGTKYMGPPADPSANPHNQQAATWSASDDDHHPYQLEPSPVDKPSSNPMESILDVFNSWGKQAETLSSNVWQNLKTAPSQSGAAWGKLSLTAKAMTGGGFESLYKQTFHTDPNEKLKKTFACYLSTSAGPVAGTLYLSNFNVAFCSDRPLSHTAPSGQEAWNYYKVVIPLAKIANVIPVTMKEINPPEKYIQIVTVDGHEFWFMGFVNFEKASMHLLESVSNFAASCPSAKPVVQTPVNTEEFAEQKPVVQTPVNTEEFAEQKPVVQTPSAKQVVQTPVNTVEVAEQKPVVQTQVNTEEVAEQIM